ncbi:MULTISPECIES: acylphosphatase [unclassified Microbacterium]|uniref:acylphosphatase n=1 Tax=unclassified Microbacterium TaxID=2609290 RepID=UPI00214CA809|nr:MULTISPECIES: acylphosphatase [unclassified Microbacterium]MCR2799802.1 acylphosphatase [Microbacterium sp. zg.Y818]MCR2825059.1 acylphosphatase [Microbacterium sp. zg.Y909]WIM21786.1 acylphosphatase [Microbacterium sp. zg-Y818]
MRRVHVIVRGEVQGVGYRYTLRMVATDAGASGWVRNRRDGSVEAEIEGTADQVDAVLAWMADGPPGSRVDAAAVTEREAGGGAGFDVLPTA